MFRSLFRRRRCDALSYVYVMNLGRLVQPQGTYIHVKKRVSNFRLWTFLPWDTVSSRENYSASENSTYHIYLVFPSAFIWYYTFLCILISFPSLGLFFSPILLCWRVIRRSWMKLDLWNALYYIHRNWYFICVCMQDKSASIQCLILEMSTFSCVDN